MLSWIAISTLSLASGQDAVLHDPTKELTDLVAKATKVESYSFVSVSETEREGGGGGFGGGRGGGEPQPVSGIYKKGLPMQVQSGELVAYKDGELVVYKNEDGEWQLMEGRGGFGGRGGGGGGAGRGGGGDGGGAGGGEGRGGRGGGEGGGAGGGGDRGGRGGGFAGMRALFGLMRTTAPHEQLADLPTLTASCEKRTVTATEAAPEKTFYEGKLTEDGAQSLGGRGFGGGRGGRGGGGGPEMTYEGTYAIEVAGGVITGAVIEITRSGTFGENSFVMTTTQKITLDKVGTAELEIPDEALALFEI